MLTHAERRELEYSQTQDRLHEIEMERCSFRLLHALYTGRSSSSKLFWRREYQGGKKPLAQWYPKEASATFTSRDPCFRCGTRGDLHGEECG